MSVDITQDEMNILNLNGVSVDEVQSNIQFMRASGLDDAAIRNKYANTIEELRPITKQTPDDTEIIKKYQNKGGIAPYEYAAKRAAEFNGTYNNITSQEEFQKQYLEQHPLKKKWSDSVQHRIDDNLQKRKELDEKVNNGTANFFERTLSALNRFGNEQINNTSKDPLVQNIIDDANRNNNGKINFAESLGNSFISGKWLPLIGGYISGFDDKKERKIQEKILNGESIREDELNYLNHRVDERQEANVRGYTYGGQVAKDFLPSLVRFGGEIAAGGWVLKSLGLLPEIAETASIGTKIVNTASNMGKYGLAGALLPTSWNDTYETLQQRLLNNGMEFTDKGSLIFRDSNEKPAISFLKSLGQTFVMFASEASGELLNLPIKGAFGAASKYVGSPISKYVMSQPKIAKFVDKAMPQLNKIYKQINKLKPQGKAYDFIKNTVKFDGFLEELGEEVVEDVLNLTLGTTDEKRTLENYINAVFKSPDEWAILAGAIALQGGALSVGSHVLGSYMERNGASDDEIIEVLNSLSENEKEQKISELATDGLIDVTRYSNEELKQKDDLKNKYFKQIKKAGYSDNEAETTADLFSQIISKNAKDFGISTDELDKKFAINIQEMSDEEAVKQYEEDNKNALKGRISNINDDIEQELNNIYYEYNDYIEQNGADNQDIVQAYIDKMQVLEDIKNNEITNETLEKAQEIIKEYDETNSGFADTLRSILDKTKIKSQFIDNSNIEKNFGDSTENITNNLKTDLIEYLNEDHIGQEYYQTENKNVVDLTNDFEKAPTIEEVKNYINEIVENGTKFATLSPNWFVDIKKENSNKKQKRITNKILNKGNYKGLNKKETARYNKYLASLEKLLANAQYAGEKENTKKDKKPNIEKYHYFKTNVKIGNKTYQLIFDTEEYKNSPQTAQHDNHVLNPQSEDNNIINHNSKDFNPKTVHLYNIKEIKKYYQSVDTAGTNNSAEISAAKKEWEEKGTKSKYFKKWFGDSKVVDESGEPLVVYHGSRNNFEIFEHKEGLDSDINSINTKEAFFFVDDDIAADEFAEVQREAQIIRLQAEKHVGSGYNNLKEKQRLDEEIKRQSYNDNIRYNAYLSIQNPIIVDFKGKEYETENVDALILKAKENGNDGIIIKNINDVGGTHTQYAVFNPEQIKSVNNKGTFNKNNPNIYFQSIGDTFKQFSKEIFKPNEKVTVDDVVKHIPILNNVQEFFTPIKDVKVDFVSNEKAKQKYLNGFYNYKKDSIFLNKDSFANKNIRYSTLRTFFHELQHARQERAYKYCLEYLNNRDIVLSDELAAVMMDYVENREISQRANREYQNFKKKHKKSIEKIRNLKKELPLNKFYEKINANKKLSFVNSKYDELYDNYKNSPNEVEARYVAQHLLNRLGLGEKYESEEIQNAGLATDKFAREYVSGRVSRSGLHDRRSLSGIRRNGQKSGNEIETKSSTSESEYGTDFGNNEELSDGIDIYFQETDSNISNTDKITLQQIQNSRGYTYQRFNFDGTQKENLITLLKNKKDKSTLIHEFAHVYLITLNNIARENEKAKEMLLTVNKWLRYDGREYTTAQHEKFANGFVAYVKSGKAPTFNLKRVFENFRKWLNDVYQVLSDNENVFIDPETQNVFEKLLGDNSLNAQKEAGYNLYNRIKTAATLRYADEAEKNNEPKNKQWELTEEQKRYRDVAYDIVYYALTNDKEQNFIKDKQQLKMILGNKNQNYSGKISNIKKMREKIYEFLSNVDDPFSKNDGMLDEWSEFFEDPGVSYDNGVAGADSELALAAYDAIINGTYKEYYPEDIHSYSGYAPLTQEEEQISEYILQDLLDDYKYRTERNLDKATTLFAYYEWCNNLHPFIHNDYVKKWELATQEIDRYAALDKFSQAKEDLKIYAAKLSGHGDYSSQFAEYAREIIKCLDFMTEKDKGKLFDKLKDFNSFRDIERNLDDVMDYAKTLADVSERRQLASDIDIEVRQTIHEWKNGIKKTKYTYPANKLFERLREINRLKQEEIQYLYDTLVNDEHTIDYVADTVHNEDYYETIEKMFIKFKANGSYYNSTEFLQDLLEKIQTAKFSAKLARDEVDFERRMQRINLIDECARALDTHKGKVSKIEQAYRFAFNLNSALEMIFNKEIKNKFSLDYLYAQRDAKVGADRDEVINKMCEAFNFKGKFKTIKLFNKLIDMTKKEFTIKQRYTPDKVNGTFRETHIDSKTGFKSTDRVLKVRPEGEYHQEWDPELVELSRMELIYYYIQSKNPVSYAMLTDMGDETNPPKGQFDKYEFDKLIDNLTPQEELLGTVLQTAAEKYYPELNKYHINKYHVDLGKVTCYFPRKSETADVKVLEMFNDYSQLNTNQKFSKQRTAGPGVRIAPANPVAVLFDHIEKVNTLIIMGKQLDTMNGVFRDSDLVKKIKNVWGEETAKEFLQQVTSNLFSGQSSVISEAESVIGKLSNNVIKSQIFLKPQVGLKQILSFMNYGVGDEYVTSKEWRDKFTKQTFTPAEWKNNIEYMMNIPYLKDRFSRGGSTDALKRQLEQRIFAKIGLLDDILSANVRYGDIGAIILGGKPYIDCLIDKGYTEQQAIRIFIEKTVNDQQSSIPSTLSNIQRNAAKQPLAKMFFAYQNTPWQYFRTACNSIIKFKQNPNLETGLNMTKLTGIYLFIFPLIFNMASSLSLIPAAGGDDDELKQDLWKSLVGGITFVPIAGMFVNTIAAGLRGEAANTNNWFESAAGKAGKLSRHISKGDVTFLDIFEAIELFIEGSTGLPATSAMNELSGMFDIITGNIPKGAIKAAGYTDYRARKITGEKDL